MLMEALWWRRIQLVVCLLSLLQSCCGEELLQTLTGSITAENYTYYRIHADGNLRVELISVVGDADLYISDEMKSPRFDDYKLQSTTCGTDSVEIPSSYSRPIGVGVYGSPYFEKSKFHLSVYVWHKPKEMTYEQLTLMLNNYDAIDKLMYGSDSSFNEKASQPLPRTASGSPIDVEDEEDEGSMLWQIFITLLKFLVEIML